MRFGKRALKHRGERFLLFIHGADMVGQSWVVQVYSVSNRAVQHMIVGRLRKIDGLTVEPTVSDRDVLVVVESPDRPHAGWVSRTVHWIDPEAILLHSTVQATADFAARGQRQSPASTAPH